MHSAFGYRKLSKSENNNSTNAIPKRDEAVENPMKKPKHCIVHCGNGRRRERGEKEKG